MKKIPILLFSSVLLILAACSQPAEATAAPETVQISIKGMTCQNCVDSITSAVTKLPGVQACDVSLEQETAIVDFSSGALTAEQIQERIQRLGFEASID